MKAYCNWMNGLPKIVKVIFCFWILDILWAIYRIGEAIAKKNTMHLVLAILWIIFAGLIGWLLDLIWIISFNRIFWFKE